MKWVVQAVGSAFLALLIAWLTGFPHRTDAPPERAILAVKNLRWNEPTRLDDRFRVVVTWLEDDRSGDDTRTVAQAFSNIKGIAMQRSARVVSASGASDEWLSGMQKSSRAVFDDWNADLVVAGRVKRTGDVLSLWIVPKRGKGTLERGDWPYRLENVTLGAEFHEDLRIQLTAVALVAVAPFADNKARSRILNEGLAEATEKLGTLLDGDTIENPGHRAALQVALGDGLHRLGEREIDTERLEKAVNAYLAALTIYAPNRVPDEWARTQNNLGNALLALGNREPGSKRLEQAAAAYREALSLSSRERKPLEWAATQSNFGSALLALGRRESSRQRLDEAVEVLRAAIEVLTRERAPLQWGTTKHNLGNALSCPSHLSHLP